MTDRDACLRLDADDPLSFARAEFTLNDGEVYLDGNSLGPRSRASARRIDQVVNDEWARGLVRSWNDAGWMSMPTAIGDRIAPLIGARPGEVLVADTLTFALAKLIGGALELRPDRHVIVTDVANFHSDLYIVEAMAARAGRRVTVRALDRHEIVGALDDDVALVMLTHVDFRTGEAWDLAEMTERVHDVGALALWDFAHSVGALPLDVTGAHVDFAAGCTYKYLNAGPGAPAFMYIRDEWQGVVANPLPGWLGHARPFDFEREFVAASGVRAFVTSSPSVIALASLDGALDIWDRVTIDQVRSKSLALSDLFVELVESTLPGVFEIVTPRDHARRASQIALRHRDSYGIIQALAAVGVVGDFRAPDIARFGFAPLYVRYVDVYDAVDRLAAVLLDGAHLDQRYETRRAVT